MSSDVAAAHVDAARRIFGRELVFAFVGGSRASGHAHSTSDVDVFVLLVRASRDAETRFARHMAELHRRHGLALDHYGEILDCATLDNLLAHAGHGRALRPSTAETACYRGNCVLSMFRKGQVIATFLAGPKIYVHDPRGRLTGYERLARAHIEALGGAPPIPPPTDTVDFGARRDLADLSTRLSGSAKPPEALLHTAVGVGLHRLFNSGAPDQFETARAPAASSGHATDRLRCPLSTGEPPPERPHAALQCLGNRLLSRPTVRTLPITREGR